MSIMKELGTTGYCNFIQKLKKVEIQLFVIFY